MVQLFSDAIEESIKFGVGDGWPWADIQFAAMKLCDEVVALFGGDDLRKFTLEPDDKKSVLGLQMCCSNHYSFTVSLASLFTTSTDNQSASHHFATRSHL